MTSPELTTPFTDEPADDAVSERAAEIFVQRRWGNWQTADQAGLEAWLAESILHEVAWLRVNAIANRADELAAVEALEQRRERPQRRRGFEYRRFVFPFLAAASLAALLPFAVPMVLALLQPADRTYATGVGERSTLDFADGTVVALNTDSVVRFRMTNKERTAWLEKGEAWFHVAHNAAHPFAVVVGQHRITDLGTEFFVRREAGSLEVGLLNGRASLSMDGAPTTTLAPGDDAVVTQASFSLTRKSPQELDDALAWRRGMLVFRNTRLADAVDEVNRYSTTRVVIADPSIADLRMSGEIRSDNLNDFLETAQLMMNVRSERSGNEIRLLRGTTNLSPKGRRRKHAP